jgi:hypothetical protein
MAASTIEGSVVRASESQMEALERFIAISPDAINDRCRRAIIWFLRQTEGLTKKVAVGFQGEHFEFGQQVALSVHDMNSTPPMRPGGHPTRIDLFLIGMGSPMYLVGGVSRATAVVCLGDNAGCMINSSMIPLDMEAIDKVELLEKYRPKDK